MSASIGLDDGAYRQGIQNVQSDTKKTIATLSSEYSKAAKAVAELTQRYNESVGKTGKTSSETKNLKAMLAQAEAQLKATTTALKAANNGMDGFGESTKTSGESLAGAMTKANLLTGVISKLGSAALSAAKGFIQTGIDYNAQIEKYTTGFTNMLGSAEAAQQAMAKIQEDAARTPFNVEALTQANQLLISAGENAGYSEKVILALGNAVNAAGGGNAELSRMAQNLQQIANVGKAASIDIKQFAYAGINIYQVLADYTGKSVQEVQNMTISYDLLSQALIAASEEGGRYYNAMNTQSQTMNGRITTLQDNFKQLAGAMSSDVATAFGNLVTKANELVVAMKDGWNTDGFQGMMSAAAQTVPQLEGVANALKWIETNSNVLIPVVETLCGAFVYFKVVMGVQGAMGAITAFLNPANLLIAALGLLAGAMVTAYTKCEPFRTAFNNAFSAVSDVAGSAVNWVMDKINTLISGVAGAIAALNSLKNGEGWEAAKNAYVEAYNSNQQATKSKQWDSDHANMEWDENDGWVPKGTANNDSGNGTSRPRAFNVNSGSSITGSGTGTTKKKSTGKKSTTETVIASVSNTVTTSAMNALGAVTTSVETLQEKVKDSAGKIKDRVTTTTTETGKEMVGGVATTYKKVSTVVDGVVTKTTKVYDDMSKVLTGTLTKVAESTFAGITTKVQEATETYADGSEHVKRTVTETGERIVNGAAETYEKVVTYVDGVKDKVTETATAIDNSVKGVQSRIEQYLSGASEESGKGIFGIIKNIVNDAKNQDWGGIALDITNLIWGEVSQGQREVISKWFVDAMGAVNEAYYGGGLSNAFDAVKAIFGDGITKNADGVTMAIKGVTTEVKSLGEIVNGLAGSGGVGGAIGSIIQSFSGMASGITSALSGIVSFIAANPILALILGLGVVAGGIGLAALANSRKNKAPVSHYRSPFEDAGVYDSLSEFSTRSAMQYRVIGQASAADRQTSILERIEGLLDEHLPAIGTGQVVMDSGELVGVISPRMAQNVDARIGVTVTRKARGA